MACLADDCNGKLVFHIVLLLLYLLVMLLLSLNTRDRYRHYRKLGSHNFAIFSRVELSRAEY